MRTTIHDLDSLREIVRKLQKENTNLKKLLDDHDIEYDSEKIIDAVDTPDDYDEDQGGRIIQVIPTLDMAKEFYSYFWGRTDVFAKRGKNGGYFPQCAARWDNPNCPKAKNEKQFCDEDCAYKGWKKLEPWMIQKHLAGEKEDCSDVLGVYPLLKDNTCHFLVFDFDNHEKDAYKNDDANTDELWRKEVDALRRICILAGIDALVERSRSGKGAHLWIFFKTAISATIARSFGYALLDRGALSINLPSFRYYDRMYPSQDVLSKLGNLVALPLQGRALRMGNSAFVDESWNAYPDQWAKLRSVKKVSLNEVNSYLREWNLDQIQYVSTTKYAEKNSQVRPWKKDDRFDRRDVIGGELHIVLDDGVYVDGLNLDVKIQNQIKGMATIDNPEFYKNKAIGRSNYYNLRTITMWKDTEGYIRIPIGLLEKIESKCRETGIIVEKNDNRSIGRPIRVHFKGELREQQELAALHLEKYENGILCAPPAFGKTVLAAYMIAKRKVSTLILLEKTDLLPQWIDEFNRFLDIDEKPPVYKTKTGREKRRDSVIGTLISGNDKTSGIIDFAMIGSAYHNDIIMLAPTGRAAQRITEFTGYPAMTAHRALMTSMNDGIPRGKLILCDESSMADIFLMHSILKFARYCNLVLVGDVDQIASVGPGKVLRDMISSGIIPSILLKQGHRNTGTIASNSMLINEGAKIKDYTYDDQFVYVPATSASIADVIVDDYLKKVKEYGIKDVMLCTAMKDRGSCAVNKLNERLQEIMTKGREEARFGDRRFRVGDRVMQIKNDYEFVLVNGGSRRKGIFNGERGTVAKIIYSHEEQEYRMVVLFDDGSIGGYTSKTASNLTLAYATTLHKCQGSEAACMMMAYTFGDFMLLNRSLFYTGETRAKKEFRFYGEEKCRYGKMMSAFDLAVSKTGDIKRNTALSERIKAA